MAYDEKLREKVLNFLGKGHTIQETHKVFEVGTTTIKEWKKLRAETGKLTKRELNRKPMKICPELLKAYVTSNPDSYQDEIAKVFNCTQPAVSYALKRMKITRKKND
jgi:transposase